jgi:hypothetical protein
MKTDGALVEVGERAFRTGAPVPERVCLDGRSGG